MKKTKVSALVLLVLAILSLSCSKKSTESTPLIAVYGTWTGMQDFGSGEIFTTVIIDDQCFDTYYEASEIHCSIQQFDNESKTGVFKYGTYSDSYLITDNTESYLVDKYRKFTWTGDLVNTMILQFYPEKSGAMEALAETNTEGITPVTLTRSTQCATPKFNRSTGQYSSAISVSINCDTPGATIRYTTDGSEPVATSQIFGSNISFSQSGVLKAKAFLVNNASSLTAVASFYIGTNSPQGDMVLVNGGTFMMGSSSYHPVHQVSVNDFYIGKYEISQKEYKRIMGENPAHGNGEGDFFPVYSVSMFNAIEYCNRRSMAEGINPCYTFAGYGTNPNNWPSGWDEDTFSQSLISCDWDNNGYRLPSEAEWEYAARGGQLSNGFEYSGSNNMHEAGWYLGNSYRQSHIIGQKIGNELGLYDMSGNCIEWVWDVQSSYSAEPQENPYGAVPTGSSFRVLRGGSYSYTAHYSWGSWGRGCTVADRNGVPPNNQSVLNGFRICRTSL